VLRAGVEPATCRLGVDNRNRSGPQQGVTSRSWECGRNADSNRNGTRECTLTPDNRAAPARDDLAQQARQDSNPDRRGWSSPCCRLHHRPVKRTARIERASREWRSHALPLSYVRQEPPAGVEPTPRPYKGRVLAVDTTEAESGDGGSRTRSSSVQTRCSSTRASSPRVADRIRTGAARFTTSGARRYTTATKKRAGATGLEPAASRLTSERSARLSYAPIARVGFEPTVSSS
jgi:hypothetical protein